MVGSFKQRSIEGLRANRTRMKQKGMNERKRERERENWMPRFLTTKQRRTTKKDDDKIYRKNTPRETKQT